MNKIIIKPELLKVHQLDLAEFVLNVYPDRDYDFSTSWSCYGMYCSPEEVICDELITSLYGEGSNTAYLDVIPGELHEVACALVEDKSVDYDEVIERISKFTGDMTRDLTYCDLREIG